MHHLLAWVQTLKLAFFSGYLHSYLFFHVYISVCLSLKILSPILTFTSCIFSFNFHNTLFSFLIVAVLYLFVSQSVVFLFVAHPEPPVPHLFKLLHYIWSNPSPPARISLWVYKLHRGVMFEKVNNSRAAVGSVLNRSSSWSKISSITDAMATKCQAEIWNICFIFTVSVGRKTEFISQVYSLKGWSLRTESSRISGKYGRNVNKSTGKTRH